MKTRGVIRISKTRNDHNGPEPFLKWAGGKGQLLKKYESFFPSKFKNYLEPFVGGGAVFFYLYRSGKLNNNQRIILIDSNEELINCYTVIKQNVEKLIKILSDEEKYQNEKEKYLEIRDEEPKDRFGRAARTIYLNKTCYNGLYRVNSRGKFNVPFGRYKKPLICNPENLRKVSQALKNVDVYCDDFEKCLELASAGDFIYFDPPYQPLSKTAYFTSYTKNSFSYKEQKRLSNVFKQLSEKKCKVMLSNSHTSFVRNLYEDFYKKTVYAKRAISSKVATRGEIKEYVIRNYKK